MSIVDRVVVRVAGDRWQVGGRVTITVDGTPMEGSVILGPGFHDDDFSFNLIGKDSWIVKVETWMRTSEVVYYEVAGRRAFKELTVSQVRKCVEHRKGFETSRR